MPDDRDPTIPDDARTDPGGGPPREQTEGAAVAHDDAATDPDGDHDLIQGLRKQRPPPRLSPRLVSSSDGDTAAAYYAGPQSLPTRADTPPLEPAVEIAVSTAPRDRAERSVIAEVEGPRRPQATTVLVGREAGPKPRRSAALVMLGVSAALAIGAIALWRSAAPSAPSGAPPAVSTPPAAGAEAPPASTTSAEASAAPRAELSATPPSTSERESLPEQTPSATPRPASPSAPAHAAAHASATGQAPLAPSARTAPESAPRATPISAPAVAPAPAPSPSTPAPLHDTARTF